jgi:glycosyltransferase A (GT-A) superfamily protein (DUF2064 family)
MRRGLAILAKAPVAGQVKTRLAPMLGTQGAADLYRCFLLDTVELVMRLGGVEVLLLYDPPEASQALREMIGESIELAPQSGGDLGGRMNKGFRDLFARGCESAIIIGTDLPTDGCLLHSGPQTGCSGSQPGWRVLSLRSARASATTFRRNRLEHKSGSWADC